VIDLWDSLIRTASALAVVLVLMGLVAWIARRLMGAAPGTAGAGPLIRVVASGYLAPRKAIALVSVAGEYLIVGTTADGLIDLGRVGDPSRVQALLAAAPSTAIASVPPVGLLASWLERAAARRPGKGHDGDQ